MRCGYIDPDTTSRMDSIYDRIIAQLITMINNSEKWLIK